MRDSLDKELIKNFVGDEPLAPVERSIPVQLLDSTIADGGQETTRLSQFENQLSEWVEGTLSGDTQDSPEAMTQEVLDLFDTSLPGYVDDLEPSQLTELKSALAGRLHTLKTDAATYHSSAGHRAFALLIIEDLNSVFEEDLRIKVKKQLPVVKNKTGTNPSELKSTRKGVLVTRSLVRSGLWGVTAFTSWHALSEFVALLMRYNLLPESDTLYNVLSGGGILPAVVMSEVMRLGKQEVEHIGSVRGLGLRESVKILFKERTKFALLLTALAIPDSLTNVTGGIEVFFGTADTSYQVEDARQVIEANKTKALNKFDKDDKLNFMDDASVSAAKAAVDEARGVYGTNEGFGPRFHALSAAYFGSAPFSFLNTVDDPRCEMGEGGEGHVVYNGWNIDKPESGTLCVFGTLKDKPVGWIVGGRAEGAKSAEQLLMDLKAKDAGYRTATSIYTLHKAKHPKSYVQESGDLWDAYALEMRKVMDERFKEIDAVSKSTAWENPEHSVVESKEQAKIDIDPLFAGLIEAQKAAATNLDGQIAELGKGYAEFDQELITSLDPTGKTVEIESPKISTPSFDFQPVDVAGQMQSRNFIEKALVAIERNPLNLPKVGLIGLLCLLAGFLDMGFFWSVKKSMAQDMDHIRAVGANSIQYMRSLVEALHAHLAASPFKDHYAEKGGVNPIDEKFVRERFIEAVAAIAEKERFEMVESGWLMGLLSRMDPDGNKRPLGEEWEAYVKNLNIFKQESPAIRAFQRILQALETYESDPNVLHDRILHFGTGEASMEPMQLINEILDGKKASNGEEMGVRFRAEMGTLLDTKPLAKATPVLGLTERTNQLFQKIADLERRPDFGDEAWVMDAVEVQEELVTLQKTPTLTNGEKDHRTKLLTAYSELMAHLLRRVEEASQEAQHGVDMVLESEANQTRQDVEKYFSPIFDAIAGRIKSCRFVLGSDAFKSEVNLATVIKKITDRLDSIDLILVDIQKLNPQYTNLRDRKLTLRDDCLRVKGELEKALQTVNGDLLKKVAKNRGNIVFGWVNKAKQNSCDTEESARDLLNGFVELYNTLYAGNPEYIQISNGGEEIDFAQISNAFDHFAGELREKLDSFGYDENMSRTFDFAWNMGDRLQKAFDTLEEREIKINIPKKLKRVEKITAKN